MAFAHIAKKRFDCKMWIILHKRADNATAAHNLQTNLIGTIFDRNLCICIQPYALPEIASRFVWQFFASQLFSKIGHH